MLWRDCGSGFAARAAAGLEEGEVPVGNSQVVGFSRYCYDVVRNQQTRTFSAAKLGRAYDLDAALVEEAELDREVAEAARQRAVQDAARRALEYAAVLLALRSRVPTDVDMVEYFYRDNNIVARTNAVVAGLGGYEAGGSAFLANVQAGYIVGVLSPADISAHSRSPIARSINDEFKGRLRAKMAARTNNIKIIMPISRGLHWMSVEIIAEIVGDHYEFKFTIHDPQSAGNEISQAERAHVRGQLAAALGADILGATGIVYVESNELARQQDGSSCGVIVSRDMEAMMQNAELPYTNMTEAEFDAEMLAIRTEDRDRGFVRNTEITGAEVFSYVEYNGRAVVNTAITDKIKDLPNDFKDTFIGLTIEGINHYKAAIIAKYIELEGNAAVRDTYNDFFRGDFPDVLIGADQALFDEVVGGIELHDNVIDTMREIGLRQQAHNESAEFSRRLEERRAADAAEAARQNGAAINIQRLVRGFFTRNAAAKQAEEVARREEIRKAAEARREELSQAERVEAERVEKIMKERRDDMRRRAQERSTEVDEFSSENIHRNILQAREGNVGESVHDSPKRRRMAQRGAASNSLA